MLAIQGHLDRGKEVIQILESLGGKNTDELEGTYKTFYYIDNKNEIGDDHKDNFPPIYKLYTLDEFEKEFPFKIGDKVTVTGNKHPKIITGITDTQWGLRYVISEIKFPDSKEMPHISQISLYKEMKEERNVTLTLDKAKELYKKGGELREIALQAFTEKELNPLPRSWEEFCEKYPVKKGECFLESDDRINVIFHNIIGKRVFKNWIPSKKSAEAHLAMIQLEQLRDCWLNGWIPKWDISEKWCIRLYKNELHVGLCTDISRFLTFPTKEMADEFLKCFRDLIELARDLI